MGLADFDVPNKIQSGLIGWTVIQMVSCTMNALVLRTVNVNWNDDGWNVNANPVENSNRWNDGNRVFSRNYWFSPRPRVGEFLPANLFSNHQAVGQPPQALKENLNIYLWI